AGSKLFLKNILVPLTNSSIVRVPKSAHLTSMIMLILAQTIDGRIHHHIDVETEIVVRGSCILFEGKLVVLKLVVCRTSEGPDSMVAARFQCRVSHPEKRS